MCIYVYNVGEGSGLNYSQVEVVSTVDTTVRISRLFGVIIRRRFDVNGEMYVQRCSYGNWRACVMIKQENV